MNVAAPRPEAFGALRLPGYRAYLGTFLLTMMADNVEHVISYWVMFQKFHSPALGGFAVVSHQTLVQMNAPENSRGRVLGLYNMAAAGLRTFSGITVGLAGSVASIHVSLALSAGMYAAAVAYLRFRGARGWLAPAPP